MSPRGFRLPAVLLAWAVLLSTSTGSSAWGGLLGANYTLNWDNKVDKKDTGTIETRTFKQTLDLKYSGFLQPLIQNEIILKLEQDRDQTGKNLVRINPVITLGYKGTQWGAGAKRTVEETNEPDRNPKITDSYFVELFLKPAKSSLPDLKAKYNLDRDFEEGTTDTDRHAFTASSVYAPLEWIQFKGDYNKNQTYDNLKPDSDTQDDRIAGVAAVRFLVSPKVKFNSEFKSEESRGWTNLDAGGRTGDKKDTGTTWKNILSFRPFPDANIDGSYDWDLKQNKENGEDTTTQNYKAAVSQMILRILNLKGDFTRAVTDLENSVAGDDNRKTDDTWTADAKLRINKLFDFTVKYQDKNTTEVHFNDPSQDTTSGSRIWGGAWAGDLTVFWKATFSFDQTDTYTKGVKTTIDRKYSVKSPLDFKAINLALEPAYDITYKEDLQKTPAETSETKDFRFRFAYRVMATSKIAATLNHTYGRKSDSLANNVQRTDDTQGNVTWRDPLPGWSLAFDVTRAATDTSEDDLEADVNSSVGFKADFKANQLAFSTNYKYDIKTTTDNSETFDAKIGWLAPRWDVTLTYNFTKTFSVALNEGYTISLAFKFIIN